MSLIHLSFLFLEQLFSKMTPEKKCDRGGKSNYFLRHQIQPWKNISNKVFELFCFYKIAYVIYFCLESVS